MPPLMGTAQVVINTRTLKVGHQTYSLANIARVQTVELRKPVGADKGKTGLAWLAGIATWVLMSIIAVNLPGTSTVGTLGFLAAIAVGILVYQKTKTPWIPMYALMLETTGNPQTALVSPDRNELARISGYIVEAIENPPETGRVIEVHNVTLGDQYNMTGDQNVGRIGSM